MTTYTEATYITATFYKTGEYPWTYQSWQNNSVRQFDAPHTTNPIAIDIWNDNRCEDYMGPIFSEIRVAEDNAWWEQCHDIWKGDPQDVDDNFRLTGDVVGIDIKILPIGSKNRDDGPRGLINNLFDNVGIKYALEDKIDNIIELLSTLLKPNENEVSAIVLWDCWWTQDYDGNYDEDFEIKGILNLDGSITHLHQLAGEQ